MLFSAMSLATSDNIFLLFLEKIRSCFFNGPIGDIETNTPNASDSFESCNIIGKTIAQTIAKIWITTNTSNKMDIVTLRDNYLFEPQPTLSGFQIPTDPAPTEINLLVFNQSHVLITIPAELSCVYYPIFKDKGKNFGFKRISISNLVNDAHGYIYTPEAWRLNPPESDFSFGREMYGQLVEEKVLNLMRAAKQEKS